MSAHASRTDGSPRRVLFREEQRFRQIWIRAVVVVLAGVAWWGFVEQILFGRPFGTDPAPDGVVWAILLLVGVGLPLLMAVLRLVVEVDPAGVTVRFVPFRTRRIEASEILAARARTYRPIRHYGGWGIRYAPGRGWAYTVQGDRGVELALADGRTFLIGSSRSDELAGAIQRLRPPGERQ